MGMAVQVVKIPDLDGVGIKLLDVKTLRNP